MRVVHVSAVRQFGCRAGITFGGLERLLAELIPAQRSIGIDADIVDVTPEVLAAASGGSAGQDRAVLDGALLAELHRRPADVVHVHDWYGALPLEALFRDGFRRIVMTAHLPLRRGFTYRDVGLEWDRKLRLEDFAIRAASVVVAPSAYVRAFLAEEYAVPDDRLRVIPHGVDAAIFDRREERGRRDGGVELLAVGRFTEQKGFELLLRAVAAMISSRPGVRLTIVGDGERRAALAGLIDQLGLGGAATLLPVASKHELARLYARATLFVLPSLFEPFGLVGLEALACGCPILAVAPTGATEYLLPTEMTPAHSPRRLATAILRRLDDLADQGNVAAAMRERALAFTWERAARAYAQVYRGCMP